VTRKEFDCLREKDEVQRRLLEEIGDLTWEERWRRAEEELGADPLLARFVAGREAREATEPPPRGRTA